MKNSCQNMENCMCGTRKCEILVEEGILRGIIKEKEKKNVA